MSRKNSVAETVSQGSQELKQQASSGGLTRASSQGQIIPTHLRYRNFAPSNALSRAYDPEYTYNGDVTTAYGVMHPKEFIRFFQKVALWRPGDIALKLSKFLNNSPSYQELKKLENSDGQKISVNRAANPLYKQHLQKQISALAEYPEIKKFAQIKFLLDKQFPKIKSRVESQKPFFEQLSDHFTSLESLLEQTSAIARIELYDEQEIKAPKIAHHRLKINLYVLLEDALNHIRFYAKKGKIALEEKKPSNPQDGAHDITLDDITHFAKDTLPSKLKKIHNLSLSDNASLTNLYNQAQAYLSFLSRDVEKIIQCSPELTRLDSSRKEFLKAFSALNASTFSLVSQGPEAVIRDYSMSYAKHHLGKIKRVYIKNLNINPELVNAALQPMLQLTRRQSVPSPMAKDIKSMPASSYNPPSFLETYNRWFTSIYTANLDLMASYQHLLILVKTDKESIFDWHQASLAKGTSNLFSAVSRVESALIFSPEARDKNNQVVEQKKSVPIPEAVELETDDLLRHLNPQAPSFEDCLTVQEQINYVVELTQLLISKSTEVSGRIAQKRVELLTQTAQSDAFILRVPSESKTLKNLTSLINLHEYAQGLIEELKSDSRFELWKRILKFADHYFQLVYKIHFIQINIGHSNIINNSSDEAIETILKHPELLIDIKLFLELVGRTEAAAFELREELLKKYGEKTQDLDLNQLCVALGAFLSGVQKFDSKFEASCNRPSSVIGFFKNSDSLKKSYLRLYLLFNHFRHSDLRSGLWQQVNIPSEKAPKSLLEVAPPSSLESKILPSEIRISGEDNDSSQSESEPPQPSADVAPAVLMDMPVAPPLVPDAPSLVLDAPLLVPEAPSPVSLEKKEDVPKNQSVQGFTEMSAEIKKRMDARTDLAVSANSLSHSEESSSGVPDAPPLLEDNEPSGLGLRVSIPDDSGSSRLVAQRNSGSRGGEIKEIGSLQEQLSPNMLLYGRAQLKKVEQKPQEKKLDPFSQRIQILRKQLEGWKSKDESRNDNNNEDGWDSDDQTKNPATVSPR